MIYCDARCWQFENCARKIHWLHRRFPKLMRTYACQLMPTPVLKNTFQMCMTDSNHCLPWSKVNPCHSRPWLLLQLHKLPRPGLSCWHCAAWYCGTLCDTFLFCLVAFCHHVTLCVGFVSDSGTQRIPGRPAIPMKKLMRKMTCDHSERED